MAAASRQDDGEPGRAREAGEPGEALGSRRDVLALVLVGPRDEEAREAAPRASSSRSRSTRSWIVVQGRCILSVHGRSHYSPAARLASTRVLDCRPSPGRHAANSSHRSAMRVASSAQRGARAPRDAEVVPDPGFEVKRGRGRDAGERAAELGLPSRTGPSCRGRRARACGALGSARLGALRAVRAGAGDRRAGGAPAPRPDPPRRGGSPDVRRRSGRRVETRRGRDARQRRDGGAEAGAVPAAPGRRRRALRARLAERQVAAEHRDAAARPAPRRARPGAGCRRTSPGAVGEDESVRGVARTAGGAFRARAASRRLFAERDRRGSGGRRQVTERQPGDPGPARRTG